MMMMQQPPSAAEQAAMRQEVSRTARTFILYVVALRVGRSRSAVGKTLRGVV